MGNASRTRTSQDTAGTQENRAKALQSAITATEKAFSKGANAQGQQSRPVRSASTL
ncbi:hypothetical protein [Serratia ureilytica]|uniref:hypothetical protein n=1 Tax=Serratia ureilytica TaxID=300181 RepID=UPI0034C66D5A